MGEDAYVKAFETVLALRKKGLIAEIDHMGRGIKAQFKYADKIGAKFVGVLGTDELSQGKVKIKRMATGEETLVDTDKVYDFIVGE